MKSTLIWANLVHLSTNMWIDTPADPDEPRDPVRKMAVDRLQFDDGLWVELTERMAAAGMNMVVLDLGDGVEYESHPEIAVLDAWTTERLRQELSRLRGLGLEPIPKLNFATSHDAWLKEYSRQVSTAVYYQVAADLIAEVAALFDRPRLFHIGMDEETAEHQRLYQYAAMRQHDLWWHDVNFLAEAVTAAGCQPWMWSDHAWRVPEEYYRRMPTSIVQSNWYYGPTFDAEPAGRPRVLSGPDDYHLSYLDLDDHGYRQIPTGSTWQGAGNFGETVKYCAKNTDPGRLLGFLQTTWLSTTPEYRATHLLAIDVVERARKAVRLD